MMPGSVCRHLKIAGRVPISRFFHVTASHPKSCNTSSKTRDDRFLSPRLRSEKNQATSLSMPAKRLTPVFCNGSIALRERDANRCILLRGCKPVNRGIGFETARQLGKQGATVVVSARTGHEAAQAAR